MIIPKSLKKQALKIHKNLTIPDVILFLAYIAISAGIVFGIPNIPQIAKWIIFIILATILSVGSFIKLKKQNMKIYVFLWYFLSHSLSRKKFNLIAQQPFVFFEKFDNDILINNYSNTNLKRKDRKKELKEYTAFFEIKGQNILNLSENEKRLIIEDLTLILNNFDFKFQIIKLNESVNLKNQREYYFGLKETIDSDKTLSINQKESKEITLLNYLNVLTPANETIKNDIGIHYYIVIYANSLKQLNLYKDFLISGFEKNTLKFRITQLNKYEIIKLYFQIFKPLNKIPENSEIDSYEKDNNLINLFKFENIKFNNENIEINEKNQKSFLKIQLIYDFPLKPNFCWLANLFYGDNTCIINSVAVSKKDLRNLFNEAEINQKVNWYSFKKSLDKTEQEQSINALEALKSNVSIGLDNFRNTSIMFIHYANDVKSLNEKSNRFEKVLSDEQILLNNFSMRQERIFNEAQFCKMNFIKREMYEIPNSSFAYGFPFLFNSLYDPHGNLIGNSKIGSVFFVDFFNRETRNNSNISIFGTSGAGKTVFIKKILTDFIIKNYYVFILDIEREFEKISNFFSGNWIDAGRGGKNAINPLEPFESLEDESNNLKTRIEEHLIRLETFLKILFPDLNDEEIRVFLRELSDFYKMQTLNWNKVPKSWCTFGNFKDYLNFHKTFKKNKTETISKIIELIDDEFIHGKFKTLYNQESKINLNNKINVIDLNTLLDKSNNKLISAQMLLTLALIEQQIKKIYSTNSDSKIVVIVDEAHLMADSKNPIAMNFLYQLSKRIRKRNGSLIIATQNINDLNQTHELKKYTTALLNNSEYQIILKLKSGDMQDLQELYKPMGGLTSEEEKYILRANKGEALMLIGEYNRHMIKTVINDYEWKIF